MGIRIPPPIIVPPSNAGDACSNCWGNGKVFGDGGTPDEIWLNFSGINKGPNWIEADGEPIEGLFQLLQTVPLPCAYLASEIDWIIDCTFEADDTTVGVLAATGPIVFQAFDNEACEVFVMNETDDHFTGGSCLIIIPEVE